MLYPNRPLPFSRASVIGSLIICGAIYFIYSHLQYVNFPVGGITKISSPPTSNDIPEKIWYKVSPKGMNAQSEEWKDDCLRKNPSYRTEVMTDLSSNYFVMRNFADRPDIVQTYLSLPISILKADLLRYLILYAEGGIWFDLDVSCEDIPIDKWIPRELKQNASMVVGWEFDSGQPDNIIRQFTTWTVMAKPKSPHLLTVIDETVEAIREVTEERQILIPDLKKNMVGDVVDFTGPRRLTAGVFKSLESIHNTTIDIPSISHLVQPRLVHDVLIMPGYSFAKSVNNHYGENEVGPVLVTHHYAGTWKNDAGREM